MNLLHSPLPLPWAVLGWILVLPLALRSLHRARSGTALHGAQQHLWLAGVVLLAWLWTLQARAVEGAAFGLLGAAFYALIFGRDKEFKGIIDNNSKRLSEMVSILKEFTDKMSENSYAIRMNSTVSENIVKKLDEMNVGIPVPVATEVPSTWNTIIVDVGGRSYQGNIETVRIRKET